jgi:hypothetical protein
MHTEEIYYTNMSEQLTRALEKGKGKAERIEEVLGT